MGAISETQLNDFLKNVERYKKESQLAKEFGDEMISGIIKLGWETWKKQVCEKSFYGENMIFCFGWSKNREDEKRHGFVGVNLDTVDGIYKTIIKCPLFEFHEDCPLKLALKKKEEKNDEKTYSK